MHAVYDSSLPSPSKTNPPIPTSSALSHSLGFRYVPQNRWRHKTVNINNKLYKWTCVLQLSSIHEGQFTTMFMIHLHPGR